MNQFVADTIANPSFTELLENAKHVNISLGPELNTKVNIYKNLNFCVGIELFIPLERWIISDQGIEVFDNSKHRTFYALNGFYKYGIEAEFEKFNLEFQFLYGGKTSHWVNILNFERVFYSHRMQRFMLTYKYRLTK